jgi:hypothetical protein
MIKKKTEESGEREDIEFQIKDQKRTTTTHHHSEDRYWICHSQLTSWPTIAITYLRHTTLDCTANQSCTTH